MEFLQDLVARLTSRKFLLSLAAIIAIIAKIRGQGFATQEDVNGIIAIVLGFNAVEGFGDAAERYGLSRTPDIAIQDAENVTTEITNEPTVKSEVVEKKKK